MAQVPGPELKNKHLSIKLNGSRRITGTLRGFDQFMNLVIEDCVEEISNTERNNLGMSVIRGNAVVILEALEKL